MGFKLKKKARRYLKRKEESLMTSIFTSSAQSRLLKTGPIYHLSKEQECFIVCFLKSKYLHHFFKGLTRRRVSDISLSKQARRQLIIPTNTTSIYFRKCTKLLGELDLKIRSWFGWTKLYLPSIPFALRLGQRSIHR